MEESKKNKSFYLVLYESHTVLRQLNPVILVRPIPETWFHVSGLHWVSFFAITIIILYHPASKVQKNVHGDNKRDR